MITKVDNTMGHPVLIRTGLVSGWFHFKWSIITLSR